MDFNSIVDSASAFITSAGGASVTIAIALEFVLRMFPSEKPLSIAHAIGAGAVKLGNLLVAFGNFLDKVLPQNVVPAKKE